MLFKLNGMKKILFFTASMLVSSQTHSETLLENSIWGKAASEAGINVSTFYGIAVQESGMNWADGSYRPWPWTLNVNEKKAGVKTGSRRYANRQSAENALQELIVNGIRNVDVGIMQINLYWHGDKVKNQLDLLDPAVNLAVAAKYLKQINQKDVAKLVASYHAPTNPVRGRAYVNRVKHYEKIIYEKLQ